MPPSRGSSEPRAVPHVEYPTDAKDEYRCILESLVNDASGHFGDSYTPSPGEVTVTRDIFAFSEGQVIVIGKSVPTSRSSTTTASYGAEHCELYPKADLQTCLHKMDANDASWGDMGACLLWYQNCTDVALADVGCP